MVMMAAADQRTPIERFATRTSTAAAVTCRPYVSNGAVRFADGIMRNCSGDGAYIESSRRFYVGTILVIRTVHEKRPATAAQSDPHPPSICLAEVRWWQERDAGRRTRYGMGVKYLD